MQEKEKQKQESIRQDKRYRAVACRQWTDWIGTSVWQLVQTGCKNRPRYAWSRLLPLLSMIVSVPVPW